MPSLACPFLRRADGYRHSAGGRCAAQRARGGNQPPAVACGAGQYAAHTVDSAHLQGGGTLIYTAMRDAQKIALLEQAGAAVVVLPSGNGRIDLAACMKDLAARGCNEVLVEAGPT